MSRVDLLRTHPALGLPVVQLLVDDPGGADVDLQDFAGKTALDYAKLQKEDHIMNLGTGQRQDDTWVGVSTRDR